jgi:hypothetical protein
MAKKRAKAKAKTKAQDKWPPRAADFVDSKMVIDALRVLKPHLEQAIVSLATRAEKMFQVLTRSPAKAPPALAAAYFAYRDAASTLSSVHRLVDQAIAKKPLEAVDLLYVSICIVSLHIDARQLAEAERCELDKKLWWSNPVLEWTVQSMESVGIDAGHLRAVSMGGRSPENLGCAMSSLKCTRNRMRSKPIKPVNASLGRGFKPITRAHESVLERLNRTPSRCRLIGEIALDGPIRNRETLGKLLKDLLAIDLVYKPFGGNGYAITIEGAERVKAPKV